LPARWSFRRERLEAAAAASASAPSSPGIGAADRGRRDGATQGGCAGTPRTGPGWAGRAGGGCSSTRAVGRIGTQRRCAHSCPTRQGFAAMATHLCSCCSD
jgi:hypothetical protein